MRSWVVLAADEALIGLGLTWWSVTGWGLASPASGSASSTASARSPKEWRSTMMNSNSCPRRQIGALAASTLDYPSEFPSFRTGNSVALAVATGDR